MSFFKDKIFVIIFLTACVLNTIPVVFNTFFLSLDGPSHLYNSNLIAELIKGNAVVSNYFSFNTLHLTNWSGHLILALFNLVAPAWLAQKVFLILLVIFFPLSFAFLVNKLNYKSRYLSFIIFPFTYGSFFFLGFYNFLLAIIFFFFWLALIYKESRSYSPTEKALIFVLFVLMECSHVFMLIIALAIFIVYLTLPVIQKNKFHLLDTFKEIGKPLLTYLILSSGGLILFLYYYFNATGQIVEKPDVPELWSKIFSTIYNISPVLSLGEVKDHLKLTHILFILLILTTIFLLIRKQSPEKQKNRNFIFFSTIITLCLYVLTMAFFDQGLYIQARCLFLFFLLWLTWIALQKVPKLIQIILVIFSLSVSYVFIDYYQKNLPPLSLRCYFIYDTGLKIEKNARVYCINFSGHWLESHQLSYLGAENSIILYDNYECFQDYFPLKWKNPELISKLKNDFDSGSYSETVSENVDYVAILDEPEQKERGAVNKSLVLTKEHFSKILGSEDNRLAIYKKNK